MDALLGQLPPRARSVVRVKQAWKLAQGPTLSAMETLLRLVLMTNELPPAVLNHPVHIDERYVYPDGNYRLQRLRDHGWRVRVVTLDDLRIPKRRRELLQWLFHHLG